MRTDLNGSRLSATRTTDESDELSRLDIELKVSEDANSRSSRVSEVDVLESKVTLDRVSGDHLALGRLGVNL
jgi:hypothetical protein